jgi:cytoskeletal protein CcmA (bactofilin family)
MAALLMALFLTAVPRAAAAPFGFTDETAEALLAELEGRYDVIALTRGYVVRPLEAGGFDVVELGAEGVLVDGERYDLDQLRELVGDDAEIFFALTGDVSALTSRAELRSRIEERQLEAAREIEENIRRQVEELESLDRDRSQELAKDIERGRRRPSRTRRTETRVALGSSLTVEEDESARDVVVILGPLTVDGEVRGDTVVVLGSAQINGRVEGTLTVVGGNVSLGPGAVVDADVNCVGGLVHRAPGAEIDGEITEISVAPLSIDLPGVDFDGWTPFDGWRFGHRGFKWLDFVGTLFQTAFLAVLILLTVLVARRRVGSVAHRVRTEPWKSGLVGFVVEVLIAPVLVLVSLLLVMSIVGIPVLMVLLPLAFLVLVVLFFLGYAGVAVALGRSLPGGRAAARTWSPFLAVLVGLVLIQIWQIVGESLTFAPGIVRVSGILLIVFGFFLKYTAWTVGLGAVMLDRFSPLPVEGPFLPPVPEDADPDEDFPDWDDERSAAGEKEGRVRRERDEGESMNPIDEATLAHGLTYDDYRARVTKNAEVFDEVYGEPAYADVDLDFFRRLPPLLVVAIGEDWCPDVYHTLPTWARLADELDGWSFFVFQRDQDPPLIDSFLWRGNAKRVPVYAFYDARRSLQTWWSGRSGAAERAVKGWLAGRTFAELDAESRAEIGRLFNDGYRREFRRTNFLEIKAQLGAFFHVESKARATAQELLDWDQGDR